MLKEYSIRPIQEEELRNYFQARYKIAYEKQMLPVLKQSLKTNLEIDVFDAKSIHVGCYCKNRMVGYIRLSAPLMHDVFPSVHLHEKSINGLTGAQQNPKNYILPSCSFLNSGAKTKLDDHLQKLIESGKSITEIGRLRNFEKNLISSYRGLVKMVSYVWALNLFYNIDTCFFNASPKHARFYKKNFNCKLIFPEIKLQIGPTEKVLLYGKIQNLPTARKEVILRIYNQLKINNGPCDINGLI